MVSNLLYLLGVIVVIVIIIALKRPVWLAMLAGVITTLILFKLPLATVADAVLKTASSWSFWEVLLIFYFMNVMHYSMNRRKMMESARIQLEKFCKNRRIIASLVPVIMGLVPAASAVILAGGIVDSIGGKDMDAEDKTFVTSFLRHIPESFIPTYSSVILASQMSGIKLSYLMLGMLPMAFAMYALVHIIYLRKLPKSKPELASENGGKRSFLLLFRSLWPIFATLLLVFAGLNVLITTLVVLLVLFITQKFTMREALGTFKNGLNINMILTMVLILIFRSLLECTELFALLPGFINGLSVPALLLFGLVFFFGAIVTSVNTIIPVALPMAFATIPGASVAVLVLLLTAGHAGMQISPLHYCLTMVCDFFKTSYPNLVKRTLPVVALLAAVATAYYFLLSACGL